MSVLLDYYLTAQMELHAEVLLHLSMNDIPLHMGLNHLHPPLFFSQTKMNAWKIKVAVTTYVLTLMGAFHVAVIRALSYRKMAKGAMVGSHVHVLMSMKLLVVIYILLLYSQPSAVHCWKLL